MAALLACPGPFPSADLRSPGSPPTRRGGSALRSQRLESEHLAESTFTCEFAGT